MLRRALTSRWMKLMNAKPRLSPAGTHRWGGLGCGVSTPREQHRCGRQLTPPPCTKLRGQGAARGRTRLAVLGHEDALDGAKGPKQLRQVLLRHILAQVAHAHAAAGRANRREGGLRLSQCTSPQPACGRARCGSVRAVVSARKWQKRGTNVSARCLSKVRARVIAPAWTH